VDPSWLSGKALHPGRGRDTSEALSSSVKQETVIKRKRLMSNTYPATTSQRVSISPIVSEVR
jgi:hypothetical protein